MIYALIAIAFILLMIYGQVARLTNIWETYVVWVVRHTEGEKQNGGIDKDYVH